ncbi:SGNH/GDSL hydrolase family protein [Metabacillus sp. GX 13764]|uniref:SGNH/GDSL hydrolase family protein n=1 Tax=Metabacillus kandeliae TaxID=2900151 RepID=UPI001E5FC9D6|nr:SGNH/GDSL hydrolase family protein [Metabacillus kandeliae]MCD7033598.1 SGNH/GDSL hydrolase family protein [Metabacillus kandeliae]
MNQVKIISGLSIAALLIWAGGFGLTISHEFLQPQQSPPAKSPAKAKEDKKEESGYNIVGLGDSLTRGLGDSSGKGYTGYLLDHLKEKTKEKVTLTNLAVSGMTSPQLKQQLKLEEVKRQVQNADAIVMTIGGNDLFNGGEVMNDLSEKSIKATRTAFMQRLSAIFGELTKLNPKAKIFYVSLYNPFSDLESSKQTSSIVREWNFYSADEAAKYKNIISVPTYDLFEQNVNDYLYSDKFHPNKEGYQLIGERLSSLITFSRGGSST